MSERGGIDASNFGGLPSVGGFDVGNSSHLSRDDDASQPKGEPHSETSGARRQPAAKELTGRTCRSSFTDRTLMLVADLRDGYGVKRAGLREVLYGGKETAIM